MSKQQTLDKLSSNLFLAGLFIGRFSRSHIPILSSACFILTAILYGSGYIAWQISINETNNSAKKINPELKPDFNREFKHLKQYSYSAIIGIIASICLLGAFFLPTALGLISSWLFLISNCFWWTAENININRLRDEKSNDSSLKAKEHYYDYSFFSTISSLVSTLSFSFCFIFPALTVPLSILVSVNLITLNIHTFSSFVKSKYYTNNPDLDKSNQTTISSSSYKKLTARKDFTPNIIPETYSVNKQENRESLSLSNVTELNIINIQHQSHF